MKRTLENKKRLSASEILVNMKHQKRKKKKPSPSPSHGCKTLPELFFSNATNSSSVIKYNKEKVEVVPPAVVYPVKEGWEKIDRVFTLSVQYCKTNHLYYDSTRYCWRLSDGTILRGLLDYHKDNYYVLESEAPWTVLEGKRRSSSSPKIGKQVEIQIEEVYKHVLTSIKKEEVDSLSTLPPMLVEVPLLNFTKKILDALWKHNILLLTFQLPIVNKSQKTVTYADAVGIQLGTGKTVIVEFKTGYDYRYKRTRGNLRFSELQKLCNQPVSDTDRNRHILQLMDTALAAEDWLGIHFDIRLLMVAHSTGLCEVFDASRETCPQRHWSKKYENTSRLYKSIFQAQHASTPEPVLFQQRLKRSSIFPFSPSNTVSPSIVLSSTT